MKPADIGAYAAFEYDQAEAGSYDALVARIPMSINGMRVVDLAAGPGTWCSLFAREGAGLTVWHDTSKQFLKLARRHLADTEGVGFVIADLAALPYRTNSIDLVFCRVSLHHSSDEATTVSEIARVLRHSGVAALVTNRASRVTRRVPLGWKKPLHYLTPLIAAITGQKLGPTLWNIEWLLRRRLRASGLQIETWDRSDPESLVIFARKVAGRAGDARDRGPDTPSGGDA